MLLNMHDAIKVSCDIFFHQTALGLADLTASSLRQGLRPQWPLTPLPH